MAVACRSAAIIFGVLSVTRFLRDTSNGEVPALLYLVIATLWLIMATIKEKE